MASLGDMQMGSRNTGAGESPYWGKNLGPGPSSVGDLGPIPPPLGLRLIS